MEEWVFKHEPKTFGEMIVSEEKKIKLQKIIKDLPNTLLAGKPGTGKGTFMNILLKESGCSYLKINASSENSVDDVRGKINNFAKRYDPNRMKILYLNECDRLSPAGQNALNQLLEDVQKISRFFFVCNNENKITDPIKSRCGYHLDLNDPPAKQIYSRCIDILNREGVKIENKSAIVDMIKKLYPDIRKIIGTLQSNVFDNTIKKISYSTTGDVFESIFDKMKKFDIEGLRKILKSTYIEYSDLYNHLYSQVIDDPDLVKNPGNFIVETGEYLYRNEFVAIPEINFMAYVFRLSELEVL